MLLFYKVVGLLAGGLIGYIVIHLIKVLVTKLIALYKWSGIRKLYKELDDYHTQYEVVLYTPGGDLDITYDKINKKYLLSIETIYEFERIEDQLRYLEELLNILIDWMFEQGIDLDFSKEDLYRIFSKGLNMNSEFDNLRDLYMVFYILVRGFKRWTFR